MNVWSMTTAEDIHVGNLLEMGNIVTHHFELGDILSAYEVFSKAADTGAIKAVMTRS